MDVAVNACITYVRGVVSCVHVLICSCVVQGIELVVFRCFKPWRQPRSRKKLLVVSFNGQFLELLAVSMDRWFINAGLVLTPGVQGPGRK